MLLKTASVCFSLFLLTTVLLLFTASNNILISDWETDLDPPSCTLTSTPASSPQAIGTSITFSTTSSDNNTGSVITAIKKGGTPIPTSNLTPAPPAGTVSYPWNTSSESIGDYTFNADAQDASGNITNSCTSPAPTMRLVPPAPIITPAVCPSSPSPATDFNWSSVASANKYEYSLSDTTNLTPTPIATDLVLTTTTTNRALSTGHAYNWSVKGTDSTGTFDSSPATSTLVCPVYIPPTPTLVPSGSPTPTPQLINGIYFDSQGYSLCNNSYQYSAYLSWLGDTGSEGSYWVDITPGSSFGRCYYHKSIAKGTVSTDTSSGFNIFDANNPSGSTTYCTSTLGMPSTLALADGQSYKARVTNGTSSPEITLSKFCRPQPPVVTALRSCLNTPETRNSYTISWANPQRPVTSVEITANATTYVKTNITPTPGADQSLTLPATGFSPALNINPDTIYSVVLKNTANLDNNGTGSAGTGTSVAACVTLGGKTYEPTNAETANGIKEVAISTGLSCPATTPGPTTTPDGIYSLADIPTGSNLCIQSTSPLSGYNGPTPASYLLSSVGSNSCGTDNSNCNFAYTPLPPILATITPPACPNGFTCNSNGNITWSGTIPGTRGHYWVDLADSSNNGLPNECSASDFNETPKNYYHKQVNSSATSPETKSTTLPDGFNWAADATSLPLVSLKCHTNTNYCVRVYNGTHSEARLFSTDPCPAVTPAWLKSTGGDVHSNQ